MHFCCNISVTASVSIIQSFVLHRTSFVLRLLVSSSLRPWIQHHLLNLESLPPSLLLQVLFNLANQYYANKLYQEAINTYLLIVKNKMFSNGSKLSVLTCIVVHIHCDSQPPPGIVHPCYRLQFMYTYTLGAYTYRFYSFTLFCLYVNFLCTNSNVVKLLRLIGPT